MSKVFWIALSALIAAAVHIAYVLFIPAMLFQSHVDGLAKAPTDRAGTWRFISEDERFKMLPGYSGSGIAAACLIDLKPGKMELALSVPDTYWMLSIYSQSGKQVYSLNDKQAGAETFSIIVTRAKSITEQIFGTGDPDEGAGTITNAAWNVVLPERRGIAILWVPSSSGAAQSALIQMVNKSSCKPTAS